MFGTIICNTLKYPFGTLSGSKGKAPFKMCQCIIYGAAYKDCLNPIMSLLQM